MDLLATPLKNKLLNKVIEVPASPLMKKIGFGTGVAVYKLQRASLMTRTLSPWAVKKLLKRHRKNKDLEKRLHKEAEVLRTLSHPNVVGYRGFVKKPDGTSSLLMEECNGCLGDMLESRFEHEKGPYEAKIILQVAYDLSKALDYLHNSALLMHCDVKSHNILVKGDFEICKLCDFGVCLPVTKSGEVDKAKAGDCGYDGTPCWCAPEVLIYPPEITTMADIYAFGLVIWEMIALSPPIYDNSEQFDESFHCSGSFDESDSENQKTRLRPALPEVQLKHEYDLVLETYYCCTTVEKEKRPTAKDLAILLLEALNKQIVP
nr:unnamed protein product [Callosobruchus chinensis]